MTHSAPALRRRLSLASATTLNMIDMIGVGPFLTLPLVMAAFPEGISATGAVCAWILGAVLALSDGLVWAELGAAIPEAGGSYSFLREIYGRERWGRLLAFVYVWQLSFSAPLSIASGCIGLAKYAAWLFPVLQHPVAGSLTGAQLVAPAACLFAVWLLYRGLTGIARTAWLLFGGVLLAAAAVLATSLRGTLPLPALHFSALGSSSNLAALAGAMLLATYDYWGYYNVAFLGGEVKEPQRTIPRAILISVVLVGVLYLSMNLSVLHVLSPGEILALHEHQSSELTVVAIAVERTFGSTMARVVAALIVWTAFASVFSLLLGYSRVPYAAAADGNYFRIFARLHPRHNFPHLSLLALGVVAAIFSFFPLKDVIAALVVIRILLQFLLQQIGVAVLRWRAPERIRFRMWLYPLPPLLAIAGFLFILFKRTEAARELWWAALVAGSGVLLYLWRARSRCEWPFQEQAVRHPDL